MLSDARPWSGAGGLLRGGRAVRWRGRGRRGDVGKQQAQARMNDLQQEEYPRFFHHKKCTSEQ